MSKHVHYDLAAAEKSMRAGFKEMNDAPRPETMTEADKAFVRMQIDLQEVQVQFGLWHLRRLNECADEDAVISAVGHAIGTMLWSFADNTQFEPMDVVQDLLASAVQTIGTMIGGGSETARVCKTTIDGATGGRA